MPQSVAGLGEVLWDMLPSGRQMGGAPANFALHAQALGAHAALISRVGNDEPGAEIIRRLSTAGVSTAGVEVDPELPSGSVAVEVNADGQPKFTIAASSAWDNIDSEQATQVITRGCDAICFGTLAQRDERSRRGILGILDSLPPATLRVLDINLRMPFVDAQIIRQSICRAHVLKLNDQELPIVAGMLGLAHRSAGDWLAEIRQRYSLRLVALTRGSSGSLLINANGETCEHPGVKVTVADAVGAGDAFTAAMTLGLLRGWDLGWISDRANQIAAFVCSMPGATPPLPASLVQAWESGV